MDGSVETTSRIVSGPFGEIRERIETVSECNLQSESYKKDWHKHMWESGVDVKLQRVTWGCNSLVRLIRMEKELRDNREDHFRILYEYVPDSKSPAEFFKNKSFWDLETKDQISLVDSIVIAIKTLHKEGIVHRDISDENILVAKDRAGRLSFILGNYETARLKGKANDTAGNEQFAPYEQTHAQTTVDPSFDIHALGGFLLKFFGGLLGDYPEGMRWSLLDMHRVYFDDSIKEVLAKALQECPKDRPDIVGFGNQLFEALFPEVIAEHKAKNPDYKRYSWCSLY